MKKTIIATLVLVISAFATATAGNIGETASSSSKKITVNTSFSKLVVEGNVDVVLYEDDASAEIRTFGLNNDMAATTITQENGVLTIRNKKGKGEKVEKFGTLNGLLNVFHFLTLSLFRFIRKRGRFFAFFWRILLKHLVNTNDLVDPFCRLFVIRIDL